MTDSHACSCGRRSCSGIVGMLVGVIIALQLADHRANVAPYLTFGRLRPLHTNAVIFAFVGNMIFAGIYYSTQRLLKTRLASDLLGRSTSGAGRPSSSSPRSRSRSGTPRARSTRSSSGPSTSRSPSSGWSSRSTSSGPSRSGEKHLYVAIWFYIATIVTVAMLYIVNNLAIPWGPSRATRSSAACRTRSRSGGTATTPSRSSSPPRSSASCTTSSRRPRGGPSTRTASP